MKFCPYCGHELDGTEKICPYCGKNLQSGTSSTPPPSQQQPPVITPPPSSPSYQQPPVLTSQPQSTQQPPSMTSQPSYTYPPVPEKTNKKSGAGWIILFVFLGLILVGAGVGAYLIYEGYIPKEKVSFLPPVVLEWLTPQKKTETTTNTQKTPQKLFYVTYAFNIVDGKKILIISSVMEPSFPEKSNKFGAEKAFIDMLKIRYAKTYFHFLKTIRTKVYTDKVKALNDREKIKREFGRDGYKVEVMEVIY